MDLWLWLFSTVSLKAQSSSRSREDPIEHGKLKPASLLQRIKARPKLNRASLWMAGIHLPREFHNLTTSVVPFTPTKWTSFSPPPSQKSNFNNFPDIL